MKNKIKLCWINLKLKILEIWFFIIHEFKTMRNLIFLIYGLFLGKRYKIRKYLSYRKDDYIKKYGYIEGTFKFNKMADNINKSVIINEELWLKK